MMTATVRAIPNAFTWRILMGFGTATLALGIAKEFSVHPRSLMIGGGLTILMLSLAHFYSVYRPRPQFAYPMSLVGYFLASALVFGPMSYFLASLNMPLVDAAMARFDMALGCDWRALQRFTAERQWLSQVSAFVYHTSGGQIFLSWIVLSLTGQLPRLSVMMTAMAIATGVCLVLSGLFPAVGAYLYYGITPAELGFLKGTGAGVWHMHDFTGLREGSMRAIDLSQLEGIVTFPSFHTVVAILCGWSLLKTRWIGWPYAAYAGFVVFTTLPFGGHHLADALCGAAIAVASIAIGWRVEAVRPAAEAANGGVLQPGAAATAG